MTLDRKEERNRPVCRMLIHCDDDSYILQDINYNTKQFKKDELKQAIKSGQLNVIDLQVAKGNKLIKKHVDLRSICILNGNMTRNWELPPLTEEQEKKILFYGLAYINSCMTSKSKERVCDDISFPRNSDAEHLVSLFTDNKSWSWNKYSGLSIMCNNKIMKLIYELAYRKYSY
ncbi:MAG: hypothetical protein HDR05_12610 [Lachnospiraceae bacterium]|nr:hypothetical protein [Lachnospiraceae bacterium]